MTHLTEADLLDVLDGVAASDRRSHVEGCPRCRAELEQIRAVVARAADVRVPEPSPLFWEHLSARVREATGEPIRPGARGIEALLRWPAVAAALTVLALVIAVAAYRVPRGRVPPPAVVADRTSPASDVRPAAMTAPDDIEEDEAWAVVRGLADDVLWDDVQDAGLAARPGSAERAVAGLTDAERLELAALLSEELKGSGI